MTKKEIDTTLQALSYYSIYTKENMRQLLTGDEDADVAKEAKRILDIGDAFNAFRDLTDGE